MPPIKKTDDVAAEATAPASLAPAEQKTGKYTVTCAGAPYAVGGDPAYISIAMHGHVIDLVDGEAMRLITLGAVRAATDEEVAVDGVRRTREAVVDAQNAAGPANNPFGGRVVGTSLEAHAAEQIALAHKAAATKA
jgi:hypothetical protein